MAESGGVREQRRECVTMSEKLHGESPEQNCLRSLSCSPLPVPEGLLTSRIHPRTLLITSVHVPERLAPATALQRPSQA